MAVLRSSPSGETGTRASISTSSRPNPTVLGASVRVTASSSSSGTSIDGHT